MPATDHQPRTATEETAPPPTTEHATPASTTGATPAAETAGIGGASSSHAAAAVSHWADAGAHDAGLSRGAHGPKVEKLQEDLNARGTEPPLKLDGSYGPST